MLQRGKTSFVFNVNFCAEFVSNVGKSYQRVEKHFPSILKHFVEHCQRFYNGLNNITNALRTIINAFKMHSKSITLYNAIFVKPRFPK